jgi:hypothetical protein
VRLFVLTPAGRVSDPAEALHQLVHAANALGFDAATVYLPPAREGPGGAPAPSPIPPPYRSYRVAVAGDAVDSSGSFVIAPPEYAGHLLRLRSVQRGLWWLPDETGGHPIDAGVAETLRDAKSRCVHLTPSAPHRQRLAAGGAAGLTLTDYLPAHLVELAEQARELPKQQVVAYRATSRRKLVGALQSRLPSAIDWVPVPGDDPVAATNILTRAAVFLDLTGSAGASRASRVATLAGCCVLASGTPNAPDDPGRSVPGQYRVADSAATDPAALAELIADVLDRPGDHEAPVGERRDRILGQEGTFTDETFTALATIEAFQHRTQSLAVT